MRRAWRAALADAAEVPDRLRAELDQAAAAAIASVAELRRWMLDDYAPRTEGVPDDCITIGRASSNNCVPAPGTPFQIFGVCTPKDGGH